MNDHGEAWYRARREASLVMVLLGPSRTSEDVTRIVAFLRVTARDIETGAQATEFIRLREGEAGA